MDITKIERKLTHPGEVLREEFLKPMNISQSELAKRIGVSFRAVNEIVNEKRNILELQHISGRKVKILNF